MRTFYVYIMASPSRTLYIGVTNNLERRVSEHKARTFPGFARKYNVTELVYIEEFVSVRDAIQREKELKGWRREKKIALIERENAGWDDLARPPSSQGSASDRGTPASK